MLVLLSIAIAREPKLKVVHVAILRPSHDVEGSVKKNGSPSPSYKLSPTKDLRRLFILFYFFTNAGETRKERRDYCL